MLFMQLRGKLRTESQVQFDQLPFKRIIENFQFSISSLFWIGLWIFGLVVLLSFLMRWWPGDRIITVRFINYFMAWLLMGLVPCLITAWLSGHKWLAATLLVPTFLIALTYLPILVKFKKIVNPNGIPLKVMSYNVWRYNLNIDAISKVIINENPDILLLQEIKPYRMQILKYKLKNLYPNDKLNIEYAPEILQAVISRYPLTPLEVAPDKGRAQKVLAETPFGRITVINIHTYHWGWKWRHRQISKLLKEDVATAKGPLILGGDFNTSDQTQTYRMVNQYLDNSHWEAGWGFGFTYPSSSVCWPGNVPIPSIIRIDHIFYSDHFIAKSARTLAESGGSDHLPVVADFIIN